MKLVPDNTLGRPPTPLSRAGLILWALLGCSSALCSQATTGYQVTYTGNFVPKRGIVQMEMRVVQSAGELRMLDMHTPSGRYSKFSGSGKVIRRSNRVVWQVPVEGGEITYRVRVNDKRRNGSYDARMTRDWALLRLDDLAPAARARTRSGARSRTFLHLSGPEDWSIETPFGPMAAEPIAIDDPERRFDRPKGWLIAGKLGIRREQTAGRQVAVAAPRGTAYPRLPTLAFLNWTLPELVEVFPGFPPSLLVVSAFDGMWRGALSGPRSVYLHGERPLISENGTSTLLHELVHVGSGLSSAEDDWIVEGLAEYYGIEILRRSGGLSEERFARTINALTQWARSESGGLYHPSSGPHTARAALLFHELDKELVGAGRTLDDVVAVLVAGGPKVTRLGLERAAEAALGRPSTVLQAAPKTQSLR